MGTVYNRGTRDKPNWWGKYKDEHGRWRALATSQPTKVQARRWIEEREARVASGKPAIEEPPEDKTFEEVADYWLRNHSETALTSHSDNVGRMKHLMRAFGKIGVSQITTQRVDEFKAAKKRATVTDPKTKKEVPRWTPNTINRMLACLRKVLNDAAGWGFLAAAPRVKLLPVPEIDFDYLRRDEAQKFLAWARANAAGDFPLYAAAIYTGARMGELYGLRWRDVDLGRGLMTIQRSYDQPYTKSKKIRRVPINRELAAVLKEWEKVCPPGDLGLVFPKPDATARPRERPPLEFAAHLAEAGVHAITFHDLRHTAASLMVMSGMNLRTVQKMLGHSTITVTERYAHLAPDFMAEDADRLSLT